MMHWLNTLRRSAPMASSYGDLNAPLITRLFTRESQHVSARGAAGALE